MFGFRSGNTAENNSPLKNLSLNSQLEAQLQQLCQPLLQGLEESPKTRTWQLQHSSAAFTDPAWKQEVLTFEAKLLDQQFLTDTTYQLHKVLLLSKKKTYFSRDAADLAPGISATIALVSVAPGQEVSCVVTDKTPCPTLTFSKSNYHSICCVVIQAGCRYRLQVDKDCMAMIYDLKQDTLTAWRQAAATNSFWYKRQLSKYIRKDDNNFGLERWIYIFDQEYQQGGVSVQHLSKQQQLAANALNIAARTGLLDIVLVRITQTKEFLIDNGASREMYQRASTTIDGWQTISGIDVDWKSTAFKPKSDLMFQATNYLDKLTVDREFPSDGLANRITRKKEKAAYMMWPCSNRWAIFCQRQGIDAAFDTLQAMAADLKLHGSDSSELAAANTSDASQGPLPVSCAPFANSQREVSNLLHIIWTKYRTDALKREIPDYISFADLIFATGSRKLGLDYLQDRLRDNGLTVKTASELIAGATLLGWSQILSILESVPDKLIERLKHRNTTFGYHGPSTGFKDVVIACKALLLLLGEQHPHVNVVVYKIVLSLSSEFEKHCFALTAPSAYWPSRTFYCRACQEFPGSHVVILFARIFQRLREGAASAPAHTLCLSGIEQAHAKLINMYRSHPDMFQLENVAPPFGRDPRDRASLAGSADMIKLLASCAYHTHRVPASTHSLYECQCCQQLKLSSWEQAEWHFSLETTSRTSLQQVILQLFLEGKPPPPQDPAVVRREFGWRLTPFQRCKLLCEESMDGD